MRLLDWGKKGSLIRAGLEGGGVVFLLLRPPDEVVPVKGSCHSLLVACLSYFSHLISSTSGGKLDSGDDQMNSQLGYPPSPLPRVGRMGPSAGLPQLELPLWAVCPQCLCPALGPPELCPPGVPSPATQRPSPARRRLDGALRYISS